MPSKSGFQNLKCPKKVGFNIWNAPSKSDMSSENYVAESEIPVSYKWVSKSEISPKIFFKI